MSTRDRLLALSVAVAWGLNFIATGWAVEHFPPLLLVALRYALIAIPTLFLVPRPPIPFRWILAVGGGIGAMQFAFLYLGLAAGMPVGLASVVIQASAPFTVILAAVLLRERITRQQAIGIGVAVIALVVIAAYRAQVAALVPVLLTLGAALGWALGNVATRRAKAPNALHLTLWACVVPPVPLAALSFLVEGPDRIGDAVVTVFRPEATLAVIGLLYIVLVSTLFGYGVWSKLMARYPSSTVAPFSMLVPPVGVGAAWLVFGEVPDAVELTAAAIVVGGVLFASVTLPRRRGAVSAKEPRRDGMDHTLTRSPGSPPRTF